jgi:hypothetical protein
MEVSPLPLDKIRAIIPLGNLNPRGGHVFPTDHIYFDYGGQPDLPVTAPAAGRVFAIQSQSVGDFKIEIRVNEHLCYYLAHLYVDPGIQDGNQVKAGQVIGRASAQSWLDLGAYDSRIRLKGFIHAARYPSPTLQTVSPLSLFEEPLQSQLKAKVAREGTNKDGRIDFDQRGRLVGNWFHQTLSPEESQRGQPNVWAKQLAFVYDVRQPNAVRISIGGTVATAGIYAVPTSAPDPASVGVETGLVKYPLLVPQENTPGFPAPFDAAGFLLVQLIGENQLKVAYFSINAVGTADGFASKASIYER